ncbi:MAG: molybdopterin-binding protein [Candidatus Protistobacter heckmanni]|nr:molybdopterin-binding protein [Candidatus Protistobacter heckmanni]
MGEAGRKVGLIIVGDEILSGRREDKHLRKFIDILGERGIRLDWAQYVGDDPIEITALLRRTLGSGDIVFSTGGIGATPDDHTRQCAAAAAGVPLELHPEAREQIALRIAETVEGDPVKADLNRSENQRRFKMGEFPAGSSIIPNPYNRIPGFSYREHHFFPGFPAMAWPMMEWVLDTLYPKLGERGRWAEPSFLVFEAPESTLTPLMEKIEADYPGVKVFSLPSVGDAERGGVYARRHIELGVKGMVEVVSAALSSLKQGVHALGFEVLETEASGAA